MADDTLEKNKGGRPPKEVNEKLLQSLTKLHLSDKVIAETLEISVDTLHRRFKDQMEMWRSQSKAKIAEVLFDEAITHREPWALKALSQKHLDYADKIQSENKNETNHTGSVKFELGERIKQLKGESSE